MADPAKTPESLEGYSVQEIANMAALAKRLGSDPKTARQFQKLVKEVVPEFRSPELEMEDRIDQTVKPLQERLDKLNESIQQREARERLTQIEREAIQHGVSEAEIRDGSFQKWASEQGFAINQLALAAKFRENQTAMSVPTSVAPALRAPDVDPEKLGEIRKGGWD